MVLKKLAISDEVYRAYGHCLGFQVSYNTVIIVMARVMYTMVILLPHSVIIT